MAIEWALAALGYAVLEYWLGRTEKTRANSVLEALAMAARLLVTRRK